MQFLQAAQNPQNREPEAAKGFQPRIAYLVFHPSLGSDARCPDGILHERHGGPCQRPLWNERSPCISASSGSILNDTFAGAAESLRCCASRPAAVVMHLAAVMHLQTCVNNIPYMLILQSFPPIHSYHSPSLLCPYKPLFLFPFFSYIHIRFLHHSLLRRPVLLNGSRSRLSSDRVA